MKKSLLFFVFLFLVYGLHAQQMGLDEVIMQAARNAEEALPGGTMVAVLNFASSSETFSDYVIEELTGELVRGRKITVVDRQNLALISQEMNLQLSGDVSDESAQAIGKMLGAQSIMSGSLTDMAAFYRFRVRVINVETAAIQTQISLDLQNSGQVAFLLGDVSATADAAVQSGKTANAKDNWVSAEIAYLGAGIRYEYMLNSKLSIGMIANGSGFPRSWTGGRRYYSFELDASFRWYPLGRMFFAGIGLGCNYSFRDKEIVTNTGEIRYVLAFPLEIGAKIDVGNPGGFFIEPGLSLPLDTKVVSDFNWLFNWKTYLVYLGMGWGF